jgi:hypothetical protein
VPNLPRERPVLTRSRALHKFALLRLERHSDLVLALRQEAPLEVEAQPPHPAGPSSTGQMLPPNVVLAGEAEAGMEARAIPEERIKAMRRRMGKPRAVDWCLCEPRRAEHGVRPAQ